MNLKLQILLKGFHFYFILQFSHFFNSVEQLERNLLHKEDEFKQNIQYGTAEEPEGEEQIYSAIPPEAIRQ